MCSFGVCDGRHFAKGLCAYHYGRKQKGIPLDHVGPRERAARETEDTKVCAGCDELKPLDEFSRLKHGRKGRQGRCKPCTAVYSQRSNERPEAKQRKREYKKSERGKEVERASRIRRFGEKGVELDQRRRDGALCEACEHPDRPTRLDHDHDTDEPRGLLCHNCNVALGLVNDDPTVLQGLIDYLNSR